MTLRAITQLQTWVIVDDWTWIVANFAIDLLDASAEVVHEILRGFVQDCEAICCDEDLRLRSRSLARNPPQLVSDFDYVFRSSSLRLQKLGIAICKHRESHRLLSSLTGAFRCDDRDKA